MANLFNNSFPSGNTNLWNGCGAFTSHAKAGRGCVGGYALTCWDGLVEEIMTPNIGANDPVSGTPATTLLASTTRFQHSFWASTGTVPDSPSPSLYGTTGWEICEWSSPQWAYIVTAPGDPCGGTFSGGSEFTALLLVQTGGKLQLFIKDLHAPDGKGVRFESAAGVFPVDGTMHGFQVSFNFTDAHTVQYNVVVDNVSVISGTYTTVVGANRAFSTTYGALFVGQDYPGWRGFTIHSTFLSGQPPMGLNTLVSAWGNVQVDNAVTISDYPACSAPINTVDACTPIFPAVVYGASFNGPCGSGGQLIIKGAHFDATNSEITVLDPDGDPVEFEIEFIAPTIIVLNIVSFVTGKYCVTVINLNMEPQDPVCARLCYIAYPTRRTRRFPLPFDRNLWLYVDRIEWLIQSGVGAANPPGNDPMIMVRFSQDGGQTYGNELTVPAGKIGEYLKRPVLNRIGKFQNGFCEISMSDPVLWALMECWVDASQSTN